jgi:predicted lipoprotein
MLKFQKTFAENQSTDIEITKLPLTITGLQALEFYFFAGAKDTQWLWSKKSKACKLMQSIAESHQSRMQKTVQFWRDWTPPKDDPEYLLRGLVQATSNHLERISTIKIQKALRQKSELNLEYPWAKLSVRVLQENFSALNLAFTKPDSGIGALLWKKNPKVFANLKSQLSEISEVAGALNPTIASFAASSIAPKAQKLRETFTKKIPGALGVRLGFNAADGD